MLKISNFVLCWVICLSPYVSSEVEVSFSKTTLTSQYFTECNNFGDFNNDGKMDVCSGPSWYEGPDFQAKHPVYNGSATSIESWASNWHSFVTDINADDYDDILYITYVTQGNCIWYTNPKNGTSQWKTNLIFSGVDNEHAMLKDVDGDGKPEIVGCKGGYYGFARINWENPTSQCKFHNVSFRGKWYANSHGIGVGDVNSDGRNDILGKEGWFEQPSSISGDPEWKYHEYYFAPKQPGSVTKDSIGPAELNVYDVNGDGRNDVISAMDSHGWGLAWWENVDDGNGGITFEKHVIMDDRSKIGTYGAAFSEPHSVVLYDIDGDGLLDLISGKRWWVHSTWGRDPEPRAAPVVYWFRLTRSSDGTVKYTPHLIDSASGIGTEIVCGDLNGDTYPDIMTASKKGAFIFFQKRTGTPAKKSVSASKKTQAIEICRNLKGSISFTLNFCNASKISINIFSAKGEKVRSITNNKYYDGKETVIWNGLNDLGYPVSRGLYVLQIKTESSLPNKTIPIIW